MLVFWVSDREISGAGGTLAGGSTGRLATAVASRRCRALPAREMACLRPRNAVRVPALCFVADLWFAAPFLPAAAGFPAAAAVFAAFAVLAVAAVFDGTARPRGEAALVFGVILSGFEDGLTATALAGF